jgi:microcystin-dependent protein
MEDQIIGTISLLPYTFAPMDMLPCDGRLLQIQQNSALFALIGTTYGGDGRTTFALPNLQGTEPVPGLKYCIVTEGVFPSRD